jgi:hypothetical protein
VVHDAGDLHEPVGCHTGAGGRLWAVSTRAGSMQTTIPGIPPGWVVDQVRYDFGDSAPVPEPATLTLLGIGLAATALRARIRGKEKAERRA